MKRYNIFLLTLMNILVSLQSSEDDKNNFVFSGKCVKQSSTFCNELVENSVCNNLKDECFCRKGYVAIREGTKISCKTLLTDLACRMDRDCVHVADSMCHPGAGQCVCPGQHVYVESINSCRRKFENANNPTCQICRQNNGQCFQYTKQDLKTYAIKSQSNAGCSCSNHQATANAIEGHCSTHVVDVGEFCNNKDLLCRSKKAVCSRISNVDSMSTCACVTGYVPVYQRTLKYYECFAIISEATFVKCSKCFQSGGYCYDVNGDQEGDGCSCQNRFSNEVDGLPSLLKPCSVNHVGISCNNDLMSVCYTAHNRPPYKSLGLQLRNGRAVAIIKSTKSGARKPFLVTSAGIRGERFDNNHIKMTRIRSSESEYKFCTNIDLADELFIEAYQLKNGKVRYSTSITILIDSLKSTPGRDMNFQISCVWRAMIKDTSGIKTFHNNDPGSIHEHSLSLDLRMISPGTNAETSSVSYGDVVKLDVSLVDSKGIYREIEVLKCWSTNSAQNNQNPISNQTKNIIYSKCQKFDNQNSILWLHASPGIHYQSSEFTPEFANNNSTTEYHCLILLCRHRRLCIDQDFCDLINKYSTKNDENSQFMIIERTCHIAYSSRRTSESVSTFYDITAKECRYSLCLTQTQTILTTVLMLFLLSLVVVLVVTLYRRQRSIENVTLDQKRQISKLSEHHINTLRKNPCSQNMYLLSDTSYLAASIDRRESEPYSMYSHLFVSNNPYKSELMDFQDNHAKSTPGVYTICNRHDNNKTPNLNKNLRSNNGQQGSLEISSIDRESCDTSMGDMDRVKKKALLNGESSNEVRTNLSNSFTNDVYI